MATIVEAWATAMEALVAWAMAMSVDVAAFTDWAIAVDMAAMEIVATILFSWEIWIPSFYYNSL